MKKYTPAQLARLLAGPVLSVLLGLILLFSPDTASALVGRILAWCCILAAAGLGAGAFLGGASNRSHRTTWAVICLVAGIWMLMNPLVIAKFLGRILGVLLLIRGLHGVNDDFQSHGRKLVFSPSALTAAVMVLAGLVLVILPLATSRLVFNLAGIVLICVGVAQGYDNLRGRKELDEGSDPNIIDVEKL